jgi:hypothetical protein
MRPAKKRMILSALRGNQKAAVPLGAAARLALGR